MSEIFLNSFSCISRAIFLLNYFFAGVFIAQNTKHIYEFQAFLNYHVHKMQSRWIQNPIIYKVFVQCHFSS